MCFQLLVKLKDVVIIQVMVVVVNNQRKRQRRTCKSNYAEWDNKDGIPDDEWNSKR